MTTHSPNRMARHRTNKQEQHERRKQRRKMYVGLRADPRGAYSYRKHN